MKNAIFLTTAFLLTACDSGKWVSYPELECTDGKPDFNFGGTDMEGNMREGAKALCAMSGSSFTGDFKCSGKDVLVNCK